VAWAVGHLEPAWHLDIWSRRALGHLMTSGHLDWAFGMWSLAWAFGHLERLGIWNQEPSLGI